MLITGDLYGLNPKPLNPEPLNPKPDRATEFHGSSPGRPCRSLHPSTADRAGEDLTHPWLGVR